MQMAKQRYVIRLHRLTRQELDLLARKQGHLTPTFISLAIEEICNEYSREEYEIHPDSEVFQLKRGNKQKGKAKINADRQMSVYLSDFSYGRVGEIVNRLKEETDRTIGATFVIRDMLFHWMEKHSREINS